MFAFLRRRRRHKLLQQPIPSAWRPLLEREVRYFSLLPPQAQDEQQHKMTVLLHEKAFEGCGGFEVTEPVRLTVAAYAALLLLNRETTFYPALHSILIYPDAFVAQHQVEDETGMVWETEEVEEGESWAAGSVLLSWKDVRRDKRKFDGRNVIIHEFAHQLYDTADFFSGDAAARAAWVRTFDEHFEKHANSVERGWRTFIDEYGAEDEAEFFSVVSEAFFEQPVKLRQRHPELYAALRSCYCQDPVKYFDQV
ncbi:MAG: zinc-dependent peptidase [Candidatus Hydrogenedentes bacterium]|nr:zinc-dependent peptidase [Candidatus Hydrogenedentota bacterium]